MAGLLDNDYTAITASGTLQTKDQTLANLRSGRMHFTALDFSERKVRFYGKTALVTSQAEVKGTTADGNVQEATATRAYMCRTRRANGRSSVLRPAGFAIRASTNNRARRRTACEQL